MYQITVTIEKGKKVVIDSEGYILRGKKLYASLDADTRKYISPELCTLTRGVDKCAIQSFTIALLPV